MEFVVDHTTIRPARAPENPFVKYAGKKLKDDENGDRCQRALRPLVQGASCFRHG